MPQKQTVSDLVLEQYSLGELSPDQQRMVNAELERDEALRQRLSAIAQSNREILADYPPERIVPAIMERFLEQSGRTARPRRTRTLAWALPAAAMVVLVLSLVVVRERVVPNETRLKGLTTHLNLFRKTPTGGAEELRSGASARRADVLQISYTAGEAKYGVILSVDGRGDVTWHVPAGYRGGSRAAPALDMQGQVVLPSAYELDDAPGFERFFLVYAAAPFEVGDVDRAARALAARPGAAEREVLGLPGGLGQYSLLLKK
jgi:hypothetical protein